MFVHPEQTGWWAGKDISLLSLCLMTLMQYMTLFVACVNWPVRLVWTDDKWPLHYLPVEQQSSRLIQVPHPDLKLDVSVVRMLLKEATTLTLTERKIGGLTWLPSRCQKTVGWGFPLVSQGNVAVRPCATIWSRGRTTNWGASGFKSYTHLIQEWQKNKQENV